MYCNVHLRSTYLCGCDCDYASMYPTPLRGKSSTPCREPPHEPSCCCNYDPFTDKTKDTEIHDLGFALRKLAVMKCQMKKWRTERLQLESEARSLKNKLKSLGVNVREPLTDDPLIIHYRDENGRLEKIREQLEDKIKDLEMTISENELYKNPCEGIQIIREKMRALREESQRDKKKLEETIKELSIEFAESSGGSPCAGITRLRAKIRELMDQLGKKMLADKKQHSGTIVEKSIVTLMALSKSCDDLRLENQRIRAEYQNLQRALRPTRDDINVDSSGARIHPVIGYKLDDDAIDVGGTRQGQSILEQENKDDTVMKMKLLECNNLIDDLRRQITDKDDMIHSLQKKMADDVEKMRINHETLMMTVANDKEELKRCEKKVEELLNQLKQDPSAVLVSHQSDSQIEIERDKLLVEMSKCQDISLSKDDEMKLVLGEKDKILSDFIENSAVLQGRIDDLLSQEVLSRKEIDELKEQTQIIPSLRNQNSELTSKLTSLEKKLGVDGHKDSEHKKLTDDSHLSSVDAQIMIEDSETQSESEKKKLQDEVDALNNPVGSLMDKLVLTQELKDSAQLELTTLKKELDQLIINLDYAQKENINLNTERDILKRQIVEIQQELSNKIADNVDLRNSIDKATSELNELQLENESLKKRIVDMVKDIENWKTEISKDTREIDKLNRELEDAKKALDLSQSRISELDDELSHSQLESHELNALQKVLSEEKLAKGIASDKMNNLNEELDALKSELMNCRDENEKLRNDLSDTKRKCTQLDEDVNNFQNEVQALKSQNEKIKSDNELLKRDSIGAQGDFQAQKIEADTLKIDNAALKGEGDRLRSENSDIKINLNNLKDINENLSSELEILKTNLLECHTDRDKLTLELENYTKIKNEYDSSIRDSEILKEALSTSEDQGRKLESSFNALKSEKESLLTALSSMRGEVDELKRNIIIKDIELKEAAVAKHELVALKNELNKCREDLERCSRDLDSSKKQIDTFKSENKIVKDQLMIADKKINVDEVRNDLENERDALKKQLHESKMNIEKIKADAPPKDALVEEMNALKDTLGKLRKDLEECNMENGRVHRELEKWKSDSEKSRTELEDVKNKNIKFVGELEALRNERGHPNREMDEVILRNSRLEEDLKTMREEMQNVTAERNKLEAANATMNEGKAATSSKYDEKSSEPINYVGDVEKRGREIERLRMENNELINELGTVRKELKSMSMNDGNITDSENKKKEDVSSGRIHGDSKESADEVEHLRRENQTLSTNLQQLKNDIGKLETENEKLKADINDSSKLNNAIVEMEKRRQSAEDSTRGNGVVNNNLEMSMDDLETAKRDTEKMIDNTESLRGGTSTEYTQLEDVKQWRRKEEELNTEIERLKKENEILKKENNGMKSSLEDGEAYSERLKRDMPVKISSQISTERQNSQILSDTPDMSNELIRALDVIRVKIMKHKEGIIRMRDNIEKIANHIWSDASKYIDSDDAIVLNTMNPTILEVLELSNDLSANILSAEEELMNLAKMSRSRWEENARLKKLVEDLGGVGNFKTLGLSDGKTAGDGGSFDPESWLAALTLTQLADLHDKICLSTLNLVGRDSTPEVCQKPDDSSSPSCNQDNLQQNYDVHNKKIAALQREISEKQIEAGRRIFEMRQILRREQAELIRISEAMYQEKKHNLILHLTIDEPPCWVNDCEGKRAKSVKFIPNIARGK